MKVMIVDDEQMNRDLFSDLLEDEEAITEIQCFENGKLALDAVNNYSPDVIILDVMMPGMDGFETCQKIREKFGPHPPNPPKVIMITGMAGDDIEERGLKSGVDRFYFKPLNVNTLIKEVLNPE
jgi:CheY-like chemotaxis protein